MGIDNTYVAYCFDEAALYITQQAMDEKGNMQWGKLKWSDKKKDDNNAALKEFITKGR